MTLVRGTSAACPSGGRMVSRTWKSRPGFIAAAIAAAATLAAATVPVWASSDHARVAAAGPAVPVTGPDMSGRTTTPIKHVVVIFDENISFDHYFGTYPKAANTDGTTFEP